MDSARFLLAIVLMVAVIVVTNLLFMPPPPAPDASVVGDTAVVAEGEATGPAVAPRPAPDGEAVAPALVPVRPAEVDLDTVIVETPLYRYGFSTGGGALVSAELLKYASYTEEGPVELVEPGAPLISYRVRAGDRVIDLSELRFRVERPEESAAEGGPAPVRFVYVDPESGFQASLTYTFDPESYLIRAQGRVWGSAVPPSQLLIDLGPTLRSNEADVREDERALAYVTNGVRQGIQSVNLRSVRERRIEEGPLIWVSLKNKYFLASVLAPELDPGTYLGGVIAEPTGQQYAVDLTATLPIARDGGFSFELFVGPQEYEQLMAVGRGLEDVNPYGWRVLRPIIRPLAHLITWALVGMHNVLNISYGWVLVLFGVLIRILLWPLNARAMRSQLKNMELQPRLKEIQDKYKNDPQRLQQEMLRLYKEEGFNPFGGCLPLLIPFPVLITLFFVFQATIEFRGVSFLWLPDLSRPDPYYILPILLGVSMFVLQKLSMGTTPQQNPQMKMMLWFMPILMVVIFINLASGLIVYYAAMNLATIPQQLQLIKERKKLQARTGVA
ncbi:MAG TPA: membrane protein insertase YidC [Longimicrobiales bacterium]|nr:membrane protein insertase YidC [Longimicrobiales bacterium]